MIGRWTELKVVMVRHSESKVMWEEVIMRSGEAGSLLQGRWVGESRLKRKRLEFVRDSVINPLPPQVLMFV